MAERALRASRGKAGRVAPELPTGTVTFLMTDIEGSTRLLQALGDRYPAVLADHYGLLQDAFAEAGGTLVSAEGDALFAVFRDAPAAVSAALEGQRRLAAHTWPEGANVRVRIGIHTGEGRLLPEGYVGLDVHRAARIASAGHGGQVVLSEAAKVLADGRLPEGVTLRDLGEHRLKDLARHEHLFQLVAPGLGAEFPPLRSLEARPNNLPAQVTSFVGRQREKEHVAELLRSGRLVTLTGPGGTGKTRLSLEVAGQSLADFADGVFFVPLATISDPALLIPTIAAALGVRESPARPIRDALIEQLCGRTILLVLDNFEQLVAAAPVVADLLSAAPGLKALATSRERLGISGEQEFEVPPLALPNGRGPAPADQLRRIDSVALFIQRARAVRPEFDLSAENAHAVAEICMRLDGLPLAIELAAARSRLFEPRDLLSRLDRRLSFVAGGGRDLPERQRSLRGAIDWSHELLAEPEQVLFRRLSVFRGGFTMEAAEAICRPEEELGLDAVDGVSSLHDKSLLRRDESATELRLAMLETIREYARDRLVESGESAEIQRRHAAFFLELAERAGGELRGPERDRWLDRLDRELDNLRAAIGWAIDSHEAETGLRLAAVLVPFWYMRNHLNEGREHLDALLRLPGAREATPARARGLAAAAELASWNADYARVTPLAEESLAIYRELGDDAGVAAQLEVMGWATLAADPAAARRLFQESIETSRRRGDASLEIASMLLGATLVDIRLDDLEAARRHGEESAELLRQAGDDYLLSMSLGILGMVDRLEGDLASARRKYAENVRRSLAAGALQGVAVGLESFGDLALLEGEPERAAVLGVAADRLRAQVGGGPSIRLAGIPDVVERARAELGDERFEEAAARGRSAPVEELVRSAFESFSEGGGDA